MKEKKQRLFFALFPDDETRAALNRLYGSPELQRGRRVHVADLHITLQFLGSASAREATCAVDAAGRCAGSSFELVVDRVDYWPRPKIAWAGVKQIPEPLSSLVGALNRELAACGFEAEKRAYTPHVTLLRKSPKVPHQLLPEPVVWPVREFCLMASSSAGIPPLYRVLHRWPLKK